MMIVCDRFTGDNNEPLKSVQHDLYWTLLPSLFTYPRDCYLWAIRYTSVETDLSNKLANMDNKFDHRVLQDAHDKIAAFYRYQHPDKLGQQVLPFTVPDCDELCPEEILEKYYTREWSSYWYEEVRKVSKEPVIVRTILTAVVYQNTDDGYEAEKLLLELLHNHYGKSWDKVIEYSRGVRNNDGMENIALPYKPEDIFTF